MHASPVQPRRRAVNSQPLEAARIPDALLNIKTVGALTGVSVCTIYRREAEGTFPAAVRLGKRCTRWRAGDVTAWLAKQAGDAA